MKNRINIIISKIVPKAVSIFLTLLAVSFLIFAIFEIIPGDPAVTRLGTQATPEKIQELRESMGLNRPFLTRYFSWMSGFVTGDLGTSYSYGMPVRDMVMDKLPITMTLGIMAFIMIVVISIPLSLFARERGGFSEAFILWGGQFIMAVPPFFTGILLTLLFGIFLKLFTPGAFVSFEKSPAGFIGYLFFPALAIALPKAAMCIRLLRTSLFEEQGKDYVRTALARGNTGKAVFRRHILPNSIISLITFLGMTLSDMVAGSLIVEQVFSVPGLGKILFTSIANRDYPVVEAIIMFMAILVSACNLLADIACTLADPRVRRD